MENLKNFKERAFFNMIILSGNISIIRGAIFNIDKEFDPNLSDPFDIIFITAFTFFLIYFQSAYIYSNNFYVKDSKWVFLNWISKCIKQPDGIGLSRAFRYIFGYSRLSIPSFIGVFIIWERKGESPFVTALYIIGVFLLYWGLVDLINKMMIYFGKMFFEDSSIKNITQIVNDSIREFINDNNKGTNFTDYDMPKGIRMLEDKSKEILDELEKQERIFETLSSKIIYNKNGTIYYGDHSSYEGEVKDGYPDGKGALYNEFGTPPIYKGEWEKGKPKSYGKYYYSASGKKAYEGGVEENIFNGVGVLYNKNGRVIYKGEFEKGKPNGYGMYYLDNGEIAYEGEVKDNIFHGEGILCDKNGKVWYVGEFEKGKIPY